MSVTRDLYQPDVVYVSPTVRLFDWPSRIDGVDRTLEFIALTIRACAAFNYEAVEHAIAPRADAAFVRGRFGRIARQELYYDPSAALERLGSVTVARDGPSCRLPS